MIRQAAIRVSGWHIQPAYGGTDGAAKEDSPQVRVRKDQRPQAEVCERSRHRAGEGRQREETRRHQRRLHLGIGDKARLFIGLTLDGLRDLRREQAERSVPQVRVRSDLRRRLKRVR